MFKKRSSQAYKWSHIGPFPVIRIYEFHVFGPGSLENRRSKFVKPTIFKGFAGFASRKSGIFPLILPSF